MNSTPRTAPDCVGAVPGDVVQGLAQADEMIRNVMLLALNQNTFVPILRRCRPLPNVRGHPVRVEPEPANVVAIAVASPRLKAFTYLRTAAIGSSAIAFTTAPDAPLPIRARGPLQIALQPGAKTQEGTEMSLRNRLSAAAGTWPSMT